MNRADELLLRTPSYENGKSTHNKIISSSAQLLYKGSLKEFTISNISNLANIPTGLVNYYFKKGDLLSLFYEGLFDFMKRFYNDFSSQYSSSSVYKRLRINWIFYHFIFSDSSLIKLYKDIIASDSLKESFYKICIATLSDAAAEKDLYISDLMLRNVASASYGIEKECILSEVSTRYNIIPHTLIDFLSTKSFRLLGIKNDEIILLLDEINKMDPPDKFPCDLYMHSLFK